MKAILTGATGFVGGELLQLLADTLGIEAVTCLTRRAPVAVPPKATILLQDGFIVYDETDLPTLLIASAAEGEAG